MNQERKPRKRSFIRELMPDGPPARATLLWAARVTIVVGAVLSSLILVGLPFEITIWDWLNVLAVPITIGAAVPLINWLQKRRELEIEERRARTDALLQFLDQLTQLLLDKQNARLVKMEITEDIREVISARTEAIGSSLDPQGNQSLTNFLAGLGLLKKDNPIISLAGRNFSGIDWRGADLRDTLLNEADLTEANLSGVTVTEAQLAQAKSLKGATMPNGQKYEEWLKSREEDGG